MKKYGIIFLLLISSLIFFEGCLTNKEIYKTNNISQNNILGVVYNSMLYKANISFNKKYFSGLILLKKFSTDSSVSIVFMSELGFSMLDLRYKNDKFEVVSCKEIFNNEKIIKIISNNFRVILQDLSYIKKYSIINKNQNDYQKLKFRHLSKNYIYYYKNNFYVNKIDVGSKFFKFVQINIIRNHKFEPKKINIKHKGLNLSFEMELINLKQ